MTVPSSSGVSPSTASARGPDTTGFRSSGQSPGVRTVHLVGPGKVGCSFLRLLAGQPLRLLAVTDRSATVFAREGLDPAVVLAAKAAGRPLAGLPGAEPLPAELAIGLVAADVVVDATPSDPAGADAAQRRAEAARRRGAAVALAGKNALAQCAARWLHGEGAAAFGIDAVLGGTGRQLVRELRDLRYRCTGLVLAANVTSTVVVQALEAGGDLAAGLAAARARGLLETEPDADLDGTDAAVKLLAVHGAVFGTASLPPLPFAAVARAATDGLAPDVLRARAARGATTRLLATAAPTGELRVAFAELPATSPFAAPPDRVVYGYRLGDALRLHTGFAVGCERTAAALLGDVLALAGVTP